MSARAVYLTHYPSASGSGAQVWDRAWRVLPCRRFLVTCTGCPARTGSYIVATARKKAQRHAQACQAGPGELKL